MTAPGAFTCPRCQRVSHNPDDRESGYCGACHDWTAPADLHRVRFRLYVDRTLIDDAWVSTSRPDFIEAARAVGDRQQLLVRAAEAAGWLWLVEVFDPSRPSHLAYARIGTDPGGMVLPVEITPREGS